MSSLPILSSESLPCSTMEPELMHNPDHRDFPFLDDRHQSVSSNQLKQQSTSEEQQNDENEEIVEEINIHSLQSLILRNPISFSDHLNFNTNVIKTPSLLNLSFNQDYSCFAVGTDCGFRFYTSDPYRETIRREFNRGIAIVTSLLRSGIFVIVGGGPHPVFPPNQAVIWDDAKGGCIGELSFRSEIRAVQLRRDRIIIVLEQNIFVYSFMGLKLIHQIETIVNPKGLCEVSQMLASLVLVCPGLQKGHIRIENYTDKKTKFIFAHDSEIACLALTLCGQFLASASSKGTLIRVFNTADGTLLQENEKGFSAAAM